MKKNVLSLAALLLISVCVQAQSLKDLLNKESISKVINAVTGHKASVNMVGTWHYTSSAIEFESENLLKKAGGAVAASAAETKMDEQLEKLGIKAGSMSFTFKADSTFTSTVGKRTLSGSYSYNEAEGRVNLKYLKLLNMSAKMNCTTNNMELLFDADKILMLITFLGSKSNSTALKTVSSLAKGYDGMLLGFELKK